MPGFNRIVVRLLSGPRCDCNCARLKVRRPNPPPGKLVDRSDCPPRPREPQNQKRTFDVATKARIFRICRQCAQSGYNIEGRRTASCLPGPVGTRACALREKQPWHARLYVRAYSDFSVPAPPADGAGYWAAVSGHIIYRVCLAVCWITFNVCALPLGVWAEPPWRPFARSRLLQFPGRIPVIGVAAPLVLAYAAYWTFRIYGVWHVILPFAAVAGASAIYLALLVAFSLLAGKRRIRRREQSDETQEFVR